MSSVPAETRRRVAPLAPEDRRAALIEATLPLLMEHGSAVSTRQIAQAAGVAEGTIFRAFPDKNSLILAVVRHALDPSIGIEMLRAIPARHSLRRRVTEAARIVMTGMQRFGRLHMLSRQLVMEGEPGSEFGAEMRRNHALLLEALASVFEPDRDRLRVVPATAARLLQLNIVGTSGLIFGVEDALEPEQIASLVLDGLVTRSTAATGRPAAGAARENGTAGRRAGSGSGARSPLDPAFLDTGRIDPDRIDTGRPDRSLRRPAFAHPPEPPEIPC